MDPTSSASVRRRLLQLGAVLFFLGLATGLFSGALSSPRMGLSAHLEGVMNGMFLIALGAAWGSVRLSPGSERVAFWSLAFGTSANWVTTLLGAIWGTGRMTPLAAPSPTAARWQESVVAALLVALSLAMLLGVGLVIRGLFRHSGASGAGTTFDAPTKQQ